MDAVLERSGGLINGRIDHCFYEKGQQQEAMK
jgi:hypothetical protein